MIRAASGVCLSACLSVAAIHGGFSQAAPSHEVYAVRYATIAGFPVASLVAGADRDRTLDIAMMFWVVRSHDGRVLLVDSGFHRDTFLEQWTPAAYERPDRALRNALGIGPDEVRDIVLTHVHWDHADGADLFPQARVWLQREEYEHHIGEDGAALAQAIDGDVAAMLAGLRSAGRVALVDGDDREVVPGVRVYTGGKHTFQSQHVSVETRAGTVVLASDNAYLYENLERRLAIAQTLDAASNLAAQARMLQIAAAPRLVVPGHDPAVFERFSGSSARVVRIDEVRARLDGSERGPPGSSAPSRSVRHPAR
jgi:glyoxylase-like metal-dependent hydrolase (beta-lactamase superfamily II)